MRCIRMASEAPGDELTLNHFFTEKLYKIDSTEGEGIRCYVGNSAYAMEAFIECLAEYIWQNPIKEYFYQYIQNNCFLNGKEREVAAKKAFSIALGLRSGCDVVLEKLKEYFGEGYSCITIQGFLRFRMKDLRADLDALADLCVDELMAKREYEDFISLLRGFVDIQTPSFDEIHFVASDNGEHHILDNQGEDITLKYINDFTGHPDADTTVDDIIISSLVSLAPRRIFMHNEKSSANPQLVETIKSIFAGRVIMCGN